MSKPAKRQFTIRRLLISALALPVLVIALVTGGQFASANRNVQTAKNEAALARVAGGPSTLITALSNERNVAAVELIGMTSTINLQVKTTPAARKETDKVFKEFKESVANGSPQVQEIFDPAIQKINLDLNNARQARDNFHGTPSITNYVANTVYSDYSDIIDQVIAANDKAIQRIDDNVLRNISQAVSNVTVANDEVARTTRAVALANASPSNDLAKIRVGAAGSLANLHQNNTASVNLLASEPKVQKVVKGFFNQKSMQDFRKQANAFALGKEINLGEIIQTVNVQSHSILPVWKVMTKALNDRADERISAAEQERNIAALTFAGSVIALVLAALVIARMMSKPMVEVASKARLVAEEELPRVIQSVLTDPDGYAERPAITQTARTAVAEVNDLSEAIESMQRRSINLAAEQAAMRRRFADSFAGLGERVLKLTNGQIETIDKLESKEQDPERLDQLFALDHATTRIVRNVQNLVMLAGPKGVVERFVADPWSTTDIARSASQATDEYRRVVIGELEAATIVGWAGSDVAAILTEFLDNALAHTDTDINVTLLGKNIDAGFEFRVIDQGFGMTNAELEQANNRLNGKEKFTEAPSRYLGYFVIAHLCERLGAKSEVMMTRGGGVTARLLIPRSLFDRSHDTLVPASAPEAPPKIVPAMPTRMKDLQRQIENQ